MAGSIRKRKTTQALPGAPISHTSSFLGEQQQPQARPLQEKLHQADCGNSFTLYLLGPPARNSTRSRLVFRARLMSTPTMIEFTIHEWWVGFLKNLFTEACIRPLLMRGGCTCIGLFSRLWTEHTASFSGVQVCLSLSSSVLLNTRAPVSLCPSCIPQALTEATRLDRPQAIIFIPQSLVHPARDPGMEALFPETRRDLRRAYLSRIWNQAREATPSCF